MIHGFAVALSPGVASAASTTRVSVRELHVNPWQAGTKGNGAQANLGDAANVSIGLTFITAKTPPTPLANAPTEIVLGETNGMMLINMADEFAVCATATTFSGFGID